MITPPHYQNELYHFGVKGMKWGIRRYQNKDGSLTLEGKRRLKSYVNDDGSYTKKGLLVGFDRKVEKGIQRYIAGQKINNPFVREIVNQYKDMIDSMYINALKNKKKINADQVRYGAQWAADNAIVSANEARRVTELATAASNRAASLSITGGTNPFLFG